METGLSLNQAFAPDISIQQREDFLKSLNVAPKRVESAQGYDTVPISTLETMLDETYLGLWKTDNFRYQVIANEIVGTIDLHVYDPSIKTWLTRSGSASVMIRQKSGSEITDIGAKIKNGLVMDFPKLSTMCLKAAAKTLAKKFGRELNRKFEDSYEEVYSNEIEVNSMIDELHEKLKECATPKDLGEVWNQYPQFANNTAAKKLFNTYKMKLNYGR